jgi:type I restriction enzyme S subunit
MATFQQVKLGAVTTNITDGKHGDCISEHNSGYYFISSKDVFGGSIHYDNARQITESEFLDTHRRTKLEIGDILITNSGTIGRMALIKDEINVNKTTFQKSVAVIKPNRDIVNNSFLYYKLLSLYKQLINLGGGSAQHNLLLGDLRNFIIDLPDLKTQTRIASVLSAYDGLIENNEKRIKALEKMAQLLYTEWFVKFKFPGYEKVEMVESGTEYGKIPEGWNVKTLAEVSSIVRGCSYSSEEIDDFVGNYYIVNLKSFNRGGGFRFDGAKYYSGSINDNQSLKTGDVVVAVTDMTNDRAVIARPARIPDIDGKVTFSADVVKINSTVLPNSFVYQLLSCYRFTEITKQKANGANVLHLKPTAILEFIALIPDSQSLKRFDILCEPVAREIDKLLKQNDNLSKTRDLLIPQLVTGKRETK